MHSQLNIHLAGAEQRERLRRAAQRAQRSQVPDVGARQIARRIFRPRRADQARRAIPQSSRS